MPRDVRRQWVIGHIAASLALVTDLLFPADPEFASMRKDNEALNEKNARLEAEVARLTAIVEGAKMTEAKLSAEVSLDRKANGKLEEELTSMTHKLEVARSDREELKIGWNMAINKTENVEMKLTHARAKARRAQRRSSEVKKLAFSKTAEA